MPTVKVPLFDTAYTNTDGVVLNDKMSYFMNGYVDEVGGYYRFPGVSSLYDLGFGAGTNLDGIFWWQQRQLVLIVVNRRIYKLSYSGGVVSVSELTGASLLPNMPVSFATDGNNCFMANGGQIIYTDGTTLTPIADIDAPTNVIDIEYLDGYLLAFTSGTKWYWSEPALSFDWRALNFASAESDPDNINAGHIFNQEIYIFGALTIEIWQNDGVTPFSRVPGGALELGSLSPHSVIKTDEGFYFLDNKRRFTFLDGRSPKFLDSPYQKEIQGLSVVSDCIGMSIDIAGQNFLIFTFPAADRSFLVNRKTDKWGELGRWNQIDSNYQRWIGNCYCYASDWNLHILGGAGTSKVYSLSQNYSTEDSAIMRDCRRSGEIDYGTSKRKRCKELRLRLKRGEGAAVTPQIMVRYRTNGKDWCPIRTISLGDLGQYDIHKKVPAFGQYISRQYEFSASDGVEIVQADAEEEIDILR